MMIKQFAKSFVLLTTLFSTYVLAQDIPVQKVNEALRAKLPDSIKQSNVMISVYSGSFPPYYIINEDKSFSGAAIDMAQAIGEILGVEVKSDNVNSLPALLMGLKAGRYQFSMGPIGDFVSRQENADFVDFVQEYVVFAVLKDNPKNIHSLADTCGLRISVMSGGSAEKVIRQQSEQCKQAGNKEIKILAYTDQPTSLLAVRSKRADAFFSSQAPLTYFIKQANGDLELAATGQHNGFDDLYQGAVIAKASPLTPIILEALQILYANGTYETIMKKWGLEQNILKTPGINLAKEGA